MTAEACAESRLVRGWRRVATSLEQTARSFASTARSEGPTCALADEHACRQHLLRLRGFIVTSRPSRLGYTPSQHTNPLSCYSQRFATILLLANLVQRLCWAPWNLPRIFQVIRRITYQLLQTSQPRACSLRPKMRILVAQWSQ